MGDFLALLRLLNLWARPKGWVVEVEIDEDCEVPNYWFVNVFVVVSSEEEMMKYATSNIFDACNEIALQIPGACVLVAPDHRGAKQRYRERWQDDPETPTDEEARPS